jgi:hypothetical protein
MPSTLPIPGQVLASPVRSFQQGKALRASTALQEKQAQALQMEMDNAGQPDPKEQRDAAKYEAELAMTANKASVYAYHNAPKDSTDEERNELAVVAGAKALDPYIEGGYDRALAAYKEMNGGLYDIKAGEAHIGYEPPEGDKSTTVLTLQEKLDMGMRRDWAETAVVEKDETGNISVTSQPTGMTSEDAASRGDPRSNSGRSAQYLANIDEYNTSSDVQELITSALPQVVEMPGAVGIKGTIGLAGSGLLTTLGQDEMADVFSQYMSGALPEDIAQLQTQLQVLRGRIIPIVTGEQGKRLSETEREIASKAVGLIESIKGPADLTKAYPQVIGAMRQLYAESWVRKFNISSRDEDVAYPYDLSDKEQRIELFTEFSEAGVDMNTAKRTMIRLKSIQGVE